MGDTRKPRIVVSEAVPKDEIWLVTRRQPTTDDASQFVINKIINLKTGVTR